MPRGYRAPLRDMEFVLHEVLGIEQLTAIEAFGECSAEVVEAVLQEAGRLCADVVAPINRPGDKVGCRLREDGSVSTPPGYPEAYARWIEGGWSALAQPPEYGGQGLPYVLSQAVFEMLASASTAFSLYPMLTQSVCEGLIAHGSADLRGRYLPALVRGEWAGTMLLTEPQAGSDLGLIRCRAEPAGDGAYRLHGTKIFITGGEQDLTENIVHLVLARLPADVPGKGGISMFLVPKRMLDADGALGARNAVRCTGLEAKMGIHGASTCSIQFDGATGYLVGEPGRGLATMFTIMNRARLAVGNQGLGVAEAATQMALAYAHERHQGHAPGYDSPAPLFAHGDVRRMLMAMRSLTEGGRIMAYETAMHVDLAGHHPDRRVRRRAADYVELMTPVCKAMLTEIGVTVASLGIQVYGGHGYIREHGMEQLMRDARINCLYEGTNGIQAMDLVGRKLRLADGALPARLFEPIEAYLREARNPQNAFIDEPLAEALSLSKAATERLQGMVGEDRGAVAMDYLRLLGLTALGFAWARAVVGVDQGRVPSDYGAAKREAAAFYGRHLLPETAALARSIAAGTQGTDLAGVAGFL